jgi:predicted DNA-binding ribbon-helix-helix protein
MKSLVVKRSIAVDGHKTSISLEDAFWTDLKNIAHTQQTTLSELVTKIDQTREGNLSSAIRLFVLHHFRTAQWTGHGLAANATSFSAVVGSS